MTNQSSALTKLIVSLLEADWEAEYQVALPKIYNFFRYRTGDDRLAEDLTSETFEKAWRNRHRYRHDLAAFSTWLFTIARHIAIDYYRKPHPEVPLSSATNITVLETVEESCQQHFDLIHLRSLLAQLSDRDQELVALKYGAGLTNRVIAELSGLSESNVGTILYRVTQQLRTAWEENP
jgi:RNA polymerase sigma-70 factor (ECF subfamily)